MNILDENFLASQRELLLTWHTAVRRIGWDIATKGIQDAQIIQLLLHLRRPTLFTRDLGFYQRRLRHPRYCLVAMAIDKHEAAVFVRRFLHHVRFNSQAKRMGHVVRLSRQEMFVTSHLARAEFVRWNRS